jgi:hypothetical protein
VCISNLNKINISKLKKESYCYFKINISCLPYSIPKESTTTFKRQNDSIIGKVILFIYDIISNDLKNI